MYIKYSHSDTFFDEGLSLFGSDVGCLRHRIWFMPIDEDLILIDYELHKANELSYVTWGESFDGIPLSDEKSISALSTLKHADTTIMEYIPVKVI